MSAGPARRPGLAPSGPATNLAKPAPQHPATPTLTRWGERSALLAGATLILAGVLRLHDGPLIGHVSLVAGATLATAITGFHGWRTNRRRTRVAALTHVLTQLTKTTVVIERARWRGLPVGQIIELRLRYSDLAAAAYGPQIAATLSQTVDQALGTPFATRAHNPAKRLIILAAKPETPARELTELDKQQQRVRDVVTETFGADAAVNDIDTRDDTVTAFTVRYRSAALKLTIPAVRRRISTAVGERLAGAWKANFALEGDAVTFSRRPPLPTYAARSSAPAPQPDDPEFSLIPQAIDEDGNIVNWDIAGPMSHLLKSGRTRTGKSLERSTEIPTPAGWTAMGDLKVGDKVFDEQGQPTTVTGVFDQPPGRPCVEVLFSDGSRITCDEEHLWYTETRAARISEQASIAKESTRARRPRLAPEIVEKLLEVARSSSGTDTITITQAAQLVQLADTDPWLRATAAAVGSTGVQQEQHRFHYRAQSTHQRKLYKIYPAAAVYRVLGDKAGTGKYPTLSLHGEALRSMATLVGQTETITARDLVNLLEVPYWQACHWLAHSGVKHQLEERACQLQITAKEVTRVGRPARIYPRRLLCEALAADGDRVLLDQRNRRISGAARTTGQIRDTLRTATGHVNHSVPVAHALQTPDVELPVPPYTLGAFLGDGGSRSGRLTSADPEIVDFIAADGYKVRQCLLASDAWKACRDYVIVGLARQLRSLGLLKRSRDEGPSKRVPSIYLRASERQRRLLLAGLLDTDGTVAPQGTTQFTTTIPALADDVLELALSLGYRATRTEGIARLNGRSTGPKWTIAFTTRDPVFRLPRKLETLRVRTLRHNPDRVRNRLIVDVRPVPSVPLRCIAVDSPSHLYLASRSMIPTHNTVTLIGDAIEAARRGFKVFVLDPKRVEFLGLRDWPNVQMVATTVPQQVALVHMLVHEMEERYRLVEEEGMSDAAFQPILFIIDEYRQLYGNVKTWWRTIKVTGMPTECPIFDEIGSLLRMAAYCRIHVDLATQRPDAEFLGGEALAVDTPVPTPDGWTTMADLQVGMHVFDENGEPTRITAATEILSNRPCYRITFSDHSTLVADQNHLWSATDATQGVAEATARPELTRESPYRDHAHLAQRLRVSPGRASNTAALVPSGRRTGPRIVSTAHLAATVRTANGRTGWSIAAAKPLQLPDADLPIDPWLLGYWLGDGHTAEAIIATADEELLVRVRGRGPRSARYNFDISAGGRGNLFRPSLQQSLRQLGLLHNKHVPDIYLRGSEHQRAELLAGLLDGAGTCTVLSEGSACGQVIFSNTNRLLIDAVYELAASLGLIPMINQVGHVGFETYPCSVAYGRPTNDQWMVRFTPNGQGVFGIGRQRDALSPSRPVDPTAYRSRYVVSVEPVASVPVRCITVEADSHLYLAGHSFIPTHNCRDNFSARAATGRLSPDGAEMMFGSAHVGVGVPLNVRGRGTIVGVDDRPKEVQFLYTPDPRRPRNDEDRALLAALRPESRSWPKLAMQLPEVDEFADDIPAGKKTNLEWEQLLRARFIPVDSIEDPAMTGVESNRPAPVEPTCSGTDPDLAYTDHADLDDLEVVDEDGYAGYREPAMVPAGMVSTGDLLRDDERGWLTITDVARDSHLPDVQLEWRDDDGATGDLLISRSELVEIRRLQVD